MWLEVLDGPGAGERLEVRAKPRTLGREHGADLIVRDARASRRHAEVALSGDDAVLLRDLGAANGTWIGEDRISERVLQEGEQLRIGRTRLVVRGGATPLGPPAPTPSIIGALLERSERRAGRASLLAAGAACAAAVAVAALAFGSGDGDRVPEVVDGARASVLRIEASRGGARSATGSGWVLDAAAGLVVTGAHVLNEGDRFTATLSGGRPRRATVVAAAPCEDLALLRVDPGGLRSLPLGTQAGLRAGQTVVALGFPSAELTSTTGVVSVARTTLADPAPDLPVLRGAVQTDTAINPGSSGGPLVDLDGRLVGVSAASRSTGAGGRAVQGVNFALGADRVRSVVDGLRDGRSIGWTGLTLGYPTADELARRGLPSGLWITGAQPGSPAARLGLTGRMIVGVDGRAVRSSLASLCEAMAGVPPARRSVALSVVDPGRPGAAPRVVRLPLS